MIKKLSIILVFVSSILLAQNFDELNNQFMLAQSYIQSGQLEKALPIMEKLYNDQKSNYEYFQTLNQLYIQLKKYDASIAIIEERINNSVKDINLIGLLGTTYYYKGNDNLTFQLWDKALKTFPQNEVNYRIIGNYALQLRAFDKAIDYFKSGEAISRNPQYFAFDLANLFTITMRFKEAAEQYGMIILQNPNQLSAVETKILNYTQKPDALSQTIKVVKTYDNKDQISFKFLLARLYIQAKEYDNAYDLYKKIDLFQNANGAELFSFAKFLYGEKIYITAEKVLKDIIEKYPDSPIIIYAKLQYAETLDAIFENENLAKPAWKPYSIILKDNFTNVDKVIDAYSEIEKDYPHTDAANEALLKIGELKLNYSNDFNGALNLFKKLINDASLSENAAQAYEDLGKAYLIKGDLNSSAKYFKYIESTEKYPEEKRNFAIYELARISFYQNDNNETKKYLEILTSNPNNSSANDALELSLLMNTSLNDSSNLATFAVAEFLTDQGKYNDALQKYMDVSKDSKKFMLQNLAELRVAEMDLALDRIDSAIVQLNKIGNEKENNIYADKALYLLGKIYQFGKIDVQKAVESYENLLANFPNSLYLEDARTEILKLKDSVNNG